MKLRYRAALNTLVVLAGSAEPVGVLRDMVLDPDTGSVEALWVRTLDGLRVLRVTEIEHWGRKRVTIGEYGALADPEDLPRLQKVFAHEVRVYRAPVLSDGRRFGVVADFTIDTLAHKILSITAQRGWFVFRRTLVVPRSRIVRIDTDGVHILPPEGTVPAKPLEAVQSAASTLVPPVAPEPESCEFGHDEA